MDTPINRNMNPFFSLLQICDPLFPIGGYTQSYGLETYVQKGIVYDSESSRRYLKSYLSNNFLYNDLLAARLAWEYTEYCSIDRIFELDQILYAAKAPRELRKASIKLGIRFIKIAERVLNQQSFLKIYTSAVRNGKSPGNYGVIFGLVSRLFEVGEIEMLSALLYNTASLTINNCAKLVPISQRDGQDILFEMHDIFERLLNKVMNLDEDSIGICCTGFDLRSMQHERLYTRLYIS